jgi:DNA-binding beta-propeller fold protein YncE
MPMGVAWSVDDGTLFITAMSNDRIARVSEAGGTILSRAPTVAGPTGVLVDAARSRLYVLGRFHNQLQTLTESNLTVLATSNSLGSSRYGLSWTIASTSYAPDAASASKDARYATASSSAPHGSSGLPM